MGRGLLIIVSGMIIVYGIIQNSVSDRKKSLAQSNAKYSSTTQAKNIANTMADLSFEEIQKEGVNDDCKIGNFDARDMFNGRGSANVECYTDSQGFLVKNIKAKGSFTTGNGDDKKKITTTVELKSRRKPFSKYSYFTNREKFSSGQNIYFYSDDVLNGPIHTNGKFRFQGEPTFNGDISSAEGADFDYGNADPNFNGSTDFNADKVDLPGTGTSDKQLDRLRSEANDGGLRYDEDIQVEFINDQSSGKDVGKVEVSTRCHSCSGRWSSPKTHVISEATSSFNGVISTSGRVDVKGEVNGNITLHSEDKIEIDGDIRYADHPKKNQGPDDTPGSDDYLGIVSEGQTKVDEDAHRDHGRKDLDIHASIMALDQRSSFTVEDYDHGRSRGKLNIYGGLIQHTRGPVGLVNGTGFSKNYTYDPRFRRRSPRGFPKTQQYERYAWDSNTNIKKVN